ncbi:hypothetical protein CLIB1444_05S05776 [[Candida] jaroonii]|uniref:Uncharacterized protein n=1 Tax=[Candida] jaroonii TaxID=467808 RepID=A0ACA9Y9V4_9ASCO|nr:hypothetical protein CLIB1444_05S05776 [[Candida] jaroonii]
MDLFCIFFLAVLCSCSLDYADSIKAIVHNQVNPNDNSEGEVWFNTTGYGLADYGFPEEDVGIWTYSSFNYLKAIASLANEAAKRCFHGDIVLLYYKFVYNGQHESTEVVSSSDMIKDIAELLENSKGASKKQDKSLYDILSSTTSSDDVLKVFQVANGLNSPVDLQEEHWIKFLSNLYLFGLRQISTLGVGFRDFVSDLIH